MPLSLNFPLVQVTPLFKHDMEIKLIDAAITSSSIFRKIIKELLPEAFNWVDCKASDILSNYKHEVSAALGNLNLLFKLSLLNSNLLICLFKNL